MIESVMTILLCFPGTNERRSCRSLTRKNNGSLSSIDDFYFEAEFELNKVAIPETKHDHWYSSIANYQGFPLVLGGTSNNKLEILDTISSPPKWVEYEGTDYPYLDK